MATSNLKLTWTPDYGVLGMNETPLRYTANAGQLFIEVERRRAGNGWAAKCKPFVYIAVPDLPQEELLLEVEAALKAGLEESLAALK